jgi:hypothetical protein
VKEELRRLTHLLLESTEPVYALRPEVMGLTEILAAAQRQPTTRHADIAGGETRTPNGLAVSPQMAQMCADEYVRTIVFLRGLHTAVGEARRRFPGRPARVLYAGCGPYATLAVPLMTVHSAQEVAFTLLDIHAESIASARSIIASLGLADSVADFVTGDAGAYQVDSDFPPDIIVLEVMQACLEAEPQVAVTRHLLGQAPAAILVPEEIRIELTLVDQAREFDVNCLQENREPVPRDRIPVAPVFALGRETVASWHAIDGDVLPAATVRIPAGCAPRYRPLLFTRIQIFQDHILHDYDSSLTCPKPVDLGGVAAPGAMVRFRYELGRYPRLVAEV